MFFKSRKESTNRHSVIRLFGDSAIRKSRSAFTLIELMVVIGIMGLLGSVSVGGYRAMQRGMAERGVMDSVNSLIRAAYQRAQIDRQPTAVYFWNETLRKADDYNTEIVVGKAVAIRRYGRLSRVEGSYLYDEFADLNFSYSTDANASGGGASAGSEGGGDDDANTMYLYPIDKLSDITSSTDLKRSRVYQKVHQDKVMPLYLSGDENSGALGGTSAVGSTLGEIVAYAFKIANGRGNTFSAWEQGMAYGLEFAQVELPHGYIFGTTYSKDVANPVQVQGTLVFNVGANTGNGVSGGIVGRNSITVSSLRPGSTGEIRAEKVKDTTDPTENLK